MIPPSGNPQTPSVIFDLGVIIWGGSLGWLGELVKGLGTTHHQGAQGVGRNMGTVSCLAFG